VDEKKPRNANLFGPLLLIFIGCIFLLNTLGMLEWSIWWQILRLWPVLLIAAGLELLIGRRSAWGSLLAAVLAMAVLVGALWLVRSHTLTTSLPSEEIRQPLGSVTQAKIVIEPGVGTLRIEASPESASLVEGQINVGRAEDVVQAFSQEGNRATYQLTTGGEAWIPFTGGWDERRVWDLGLSPGATLDLESSLGVGSSELDLTGLALSSLMATTGIGRMEVLLPAEGRFQAQVDGAIGMTVIVIPEGMAARIQADTALASRKVPEGYEEQQDGVYVSPGYATAENRVDLVLTQALGAVEIRPQD
jgi:hypothetical protein